MTRPAWQDVPRSKLDRFEAIARSEAPELAQMILFQIRQEYPYLQLVEDESGEPLALVGIRRAIEGFVHNLTAGAHPRVPPEMFQEFGRGEGLEGRSLDALQAIYRLGVRLTWRRLAEIGQQVDIPAPAMYELAESGFEYLDGLVEQSVRGYAEAAARRASERLRLQRQLIELLLVEHRGDVSVALAERAARIGWELPETISVGVLMRPAREAVAPAVGQGILLEMESEQPRIVIPDPDTAGRAEILRRATAGWSGAIGPAVPLASAATSLRWAETAVQLIKKGLLPQGEVLYCTERTEELLLLPAEELIDASARRCLAPLDGLSPTQARRLAETLLAWIETPAAPRRWPPGSASTPRRPATGCGRSASCGVTPSTNRTSASRCCWCSAPGASGAIPPPPRAERRPGGRTSTNVRPPGPSADRRDQTGVTYAPAIPPSTRKSVAFTNEESSLARNATAAAISVGSANRPTGMCTRRRAARSGSLANSSWSSGVLTGPGHRALTRIPSRANCTPARATSPGPRPWTRCTRSARWPRPSGPRRTPC